MRLRSHRRSRFFKLMLMLLPGLCLLATWELIVRNIDQGIFRYGSPLRIVDVALEEFRNPAIYWDLYITSLETLLGLLIGSTLGTTIGLLLWINKTVGKLFEPYVVIAGAVPILALAPVIINWFGTGLLAKVVIASFSTLLVSIIQATEGAKTADQERVQFVQVLKATRLQIVKAVILPSSISWVLAGFRLNIGFALIGAVVAEFISSEYGLGRFIVRNSGIYDTPRVLLGISLLSAVGLMLNGITALITRKLLPWQVNLSENT